MSLMELVNSVPDSDKMEGVTSSQVKEVIRSVLQVLANTDLKDVSKMLSRYKG